MGKQSRKQGQIARRSERELKQMLMSQLETKVEDVLQAVREEWSFRERMRLALWLLFGKKPIKLEAANDV